MMARNKDLQRRRPPRGGWTVETLRKIGQARCDWCGKIGQTRNFARDIMEGMDAPLVCRDMKACAIRARKKK